MKTSDFYFDLPEELIAQEPLADRASSRLMVVHKDSGRREHGIFGTLRSICAQGTVWLSTIPRFCLPDYTAKESAQARRWRFFCW